MVDPRSPRSPSPIALANLTQALTQSLSQDQSLENWIRTLHTIYQCYRGIPITIGLGEGANKYTPRPSIAARVLEHRPSDWEQANTQLPCQHQIQLYPRPGHSQLVVDNPVRDDLVRDNRPPSPPSSPSPPPLPIHLL